MEIVHEKLTAIGDAIRGKTGKSDMLSLDDMASEITTIETGVELNFEVVGGTEEPSNPNENMIWVNTDVDITSWIFSAAEPAAPQEGMVWIPISTASPASFNALKKNGLQVYPLSAKQYVAGVWVDVIVKSYQGGEWVEWISTLTVFDRTAQTYSEILQNLHIVDGANYSPISDAGSYVKMAVAGGSTVWRAWQWKVPIDFSRYKTIEIVGYASGGYGGFGISDSLKNGTTYTAATNSGSKSLGSSYDTYTMDISSISFTGYIAFTAAPNQATFIQSVKLK